MSTPIDECTVNRPDKVVHRDEKEKPSRWCEDNIKQGVKCAPGDSTYPGIPDTVEFIPMRIVVIKTPRIFFPVDHEIAVDDFGVPHHRKDILEEVGGVRILLGVTVSMMHPM